MKKQYFVRFGSFGNMYSLRWADTAEGVQALLRDGYDRTPRSEAVGLARAERWRREYDRAFSGYADSQVLPWEGYDLPDPYEAHFAMGHTRSYPVIFDPRPRTGKGA